MMSMAMFGTKTWTLIFITIATYSDAVNGAYSPAAETTIRKNTMLATSYDHVSRPNATTEVKIGLSILAIDELNLKSQVLTMAGWVTFEWEDYRLQWDPVTNDAITSVFTEPGTVWQPEVVVDNSLADVGVIADSNLYLRVSSDGKVDWEPLRIFSTHCEVDITFYPSDRQNCTIRLATWGFTVDEVKLSALSTGLDLQNTKTHGEWIITDSDTSATNITEILNGVTKTHSTLDFSIFIERRTTFYDMNVVLPIVLTSLLVMITFIVPFESGEKLSYVLTVFLSLTVLLTIVTDTLPPTSITTSVLALYLCIVTVLSSVGILLTVLLLLLYHREGQPLPSSWIYILTRYAAKITRSSKSQNFQKAAVMKVKPIGNFDTRPTTASTIKSTEAMGLEEPHEQVSWTDIATVLDRLCFIFFTAVTIIVNISFMIALAAGGNNSNP